MYCKTERIGKMKLRELHEAATPGPWNYGGPKRIVYKGQEGPLMSYLRGTRGSPEGMLVSLGSERVVDHKLVAYLRNHAADFIALIDAAKSVTWFDWSDNDDDAACAVECLRDALKPFGEKEVDGTNFILGENNPSHCPKCMGVEINRCHRPGDAYAPECWYWMCECGHQWGIK